MRPIPKIRYPGRYRVAKYRNTTYNLHLALANALGHLGISPVYDMREVPKNVHANLWSKAMDAKFSPDATSWDRNNFDQLLSGYQALADFPTVMFPQELIKAYPGAVIILTTSSEDSWFNSMKETLVPARASLKEDDHSPMAALLRKCHRYCWDDDFEKSGINFFRRHNAEVREMVKTESREFLEYKLEDGWAPLCQFLGVAVPESVPFPNADE